MEIKETHIRLEPGFDSWSSFNSLTQWDAAIILKVLSQNTWYRLSSWALLVKLLSGECHRTPLRKTSDVLHVNKISVRLNDSIEHKAYHVSLTFYFTSNCPAIYHVGPLKNNLLKPPYTADICTPTVTHSPHRISAGGSLLFMRCVSLTLTELIQHGDEGKHPRQFWLSPCQIV